MRDERREGETRAEAVQEQLRVGEDPQGASRAAD
jgi:hypothetical protein